MTRREDEGARVRERLLRISEASGADETPPGALSAPAGLPPGAGLTPADVLAAAGLSAPERLSSASVFDPGRRGVRALALVAAAVLIVAAVLAWRARPRAEPVAPAPAEASAGTADPAGNAVVVAVAGKVRRPGLVRLPPGARVADAIEAAGGVLPGTDLSQINLARKVTDGELISVGVAGTAAGGGSTPGGRVNLNTATLAQLDGLPGVGTVLAQRILDYRERHGGFRSVTELRHVDGIGEARFQELKDLVTV